MGTRGWIGSFWEIRPRTPSVWWGGRSGLWGKSGMTRCPARLVVFRLSPKGKVQELVHWGKDQACGPSTGLCGWQCPYRHNRPGVLA